jgi:hypothetical protein
MSKKNKKLTKRNKNSVSTEEKITIIIIAICFAVVYGFIKPTFFD